MNLSKYYTFLLWFDLLCTAWSKCKPSSYHCGLGKYMVARDRCECATCSFGMYKDWESIGWKNSSCNYCKQCQRINNWRLTRSCNATVNSECGCCPGYERTSQSDKVDGACVKIRAGSETLQCINLPGSDHPSPSDGLSTVTTTTGLFIISPSPSVSSSGVVSSVSQIPSVSEMSPVSSSGVVSFVSQLPSVSEISTQTLPSLSPPVWSTPVWSTPSVTIPVTSASFKQNQGGESHASIVLIIGVTLGVVVIIAVTAMLAITIKLKNRKHVSITGNIQDSTGETARLIVQDTDSQELQLGHCSESKPNEGETLAIDGERDLDGTDGTVQRGDDEPVFLPEEPVPPELIPSVLETQQGGDTQEVGDSSPPLDATASTPCITEASCTGPIRYVCDLPARTKERIGVIISDCQSNQCRFEILGEMLHLTKEDIAKLRVHVQHQGPVGDMFFRFLEQRYRELTVDDLCDMVRCLGRPDLADDIRMWMKEDCSLIEGCTPDSGCIIQPSTT